MKPSTQGGLPPNKIATDKEQASGEHLALTRAMDAGNARRDGGYTINNFDRENHFYKSSNFQRITFSDSFLFEGGLMDLWKDLAQKHQNGTL